MRQKQDINSVEWQTLLIVLLCYAAWIIGTTWLAAVWMPLGFVTTTLAIALHSSLSHEVLHGHPFRVKPLNESLVFPAIGLFIPFGRFRDTHLAHHHDENLTDPYDDPESNYMDPKVWAHLNTPVQKILRFNNTLLGRILIGPLVSQVSFMWSDWAMIRRGDINIRNAWIWHFIGAVPVIWWMFWVMQLPVLAYVLAAYFGLSILKIRTFLEHRAHTDAQGRTVVIEGQGFFSFIFLNNNFHIAHHSRPEIPWYHLPTLYFDHRDEFIALNDGYVYKSYTEIFARYFLHPKDPVPHPLWKD